MAQVPEILAVLRISIIDSPTRGVIYLAKINQKTFSLCTCRGKLSPVFIGIDESSVYHLAREWFMEQFDGFVKVVKLEEDEEREELKKFYQLKVEFPS
jgi:hypothetical protein